MFNNSFQAHDIAYKLDISEGGDNSRRPAPRARVISDVCLPARLPATGFLEREGERNAPRALLKQLRRTPPPSPTLSDGEHPPRERTDSTASRKSVEGIANMFKFKTHQVNSPWKEPPPYEVFSAIERKDLVFLMEVRDRAFHLLLRKTGDATPLLHAMRIGDSHREVAIVLLGAMSRWVNHLEDRDINDKKTKVLLKALRTNLKLAIDYGLQSAQSDLIASFLQTLIMSEGDRWVQGQADSVALALRSGVEGKPVQTAEAAVRRFATKELGKASAIAALEDYIANATADLLCIAAWSTALNSIPSGEPIPTYYFARDDRVYRAFLDRVHSHKVQIERTLSRRLKWQIRILVKALEGRSTSFRSKVELLQEELDNGEGV